MIINLTELEKDLRGGLVQAVTEEAKQAFVDYVDTELMDSIENIASAYIEAIEQSAEEETGWCYYRDKVFIPVFISASIFVIRSSLRYMRKVKD